MNKKLLIFLSIFSVISIVALIITLSNTSSHYDRRVNKQQEEIERLNLLNDKITKEYSLLLDSLDYWKEYALSRDIVNGQLQDSLEVYKEDAFIYKYKIERIKAYDNIVKNNSSQSKYFLGWVRRVLED